MKKASAHKSRFWTFLKSLLAWSGLGPSGEQRMFRSFEYRLKADHERLNKLEQATHTLVLQRNRAEAKYLALKKDEQLQERKTTTAALRQKIQQSEIDLEKANAKCSYAKKVLQKQRTQHDSLRLEGRSTHEKLRGLRAQETIIDVVQQCRSENHQLDSFRNTQEKRQRCADEEFDASKSVLGLDEGHEPGELEEYEALGKQLRALGAQSPPEEHPLPQNFVQNISPNSEVLR